jgi:hypothetical protein
VYKKGLSFAAKRDALNTILNNHIGQVKFKMDSTLSLTPAIALIGWQNKSQIAFMQW